MISILNSKRNYKQDMILQDALVVAKQFICETYAPKDIIWCTECPYEIRSLCRDFRRASDFINSKYSRPVENSVENVENQNPQRGMGDC